MTTYTVHEALVPPRELDRRADDVLFVKDGFSWWAFFAPLPWLIYQLLWVEALAYCLVTGSIIVTMTSAFRAGDGESLQSAIFLANLLVSLLLAFHANDLRRWAMIRRGRPLVAVVSGGTFRECERRFFEAWLPYAIQDQARRWSNPTLSPAIGVNPARPISGERIIGFPGEGG